MIDYLPFSSVFRLAPPHFDSEVKVARILHDDKEWIKPDFSSSCHRLEKLSLKDEWDQRPPCNHVAYNLLFDNVVISSESGLIRTSSGRVVGDSFDHARAVLDLYKETEHNEIAMPTPKEQLIGCWLSLLFPNQDNYYHCLVMNLGRLFQINTQEAKTIDGVLIPYHLTDVESRALQLGLKQVFGDREIIIKRVQWGQSLEVERVFFPWNAVSLALGYAHSGIISFYQKVTHLLNYIEVSIPKRFYIDRRAASNRKLHNESELIECLEQQGFAIIQLEYLTFDEQAFLFANAEYIVGAHGAGLANLVFCQSGAKIIELMPHTLLRWCYRQVALVADLSYQCVITQSKSDLEGIPPAWASHVISIPDILDALNH